MPNYIYTTDIPDGPHNPSADQPNMKTNTNSINSLIGEDHYSFNNSSNFSGLHKQVRMPSVISIPPGFISGTSNLYSKVSNGQSQLFFSPGASGNEYQMTRSLVATYPLFGKNTNNYNGVGVAFTGGYTFLAGGSSGGLLFQYGDYNPGSFSSTQNSPNIQYPIAFTSQVFEVYITMYGASSTANIVSVTDKTGLTSFKWQFTGGGSTSYTGFSWLALGI